MGQQLRTYGFINAKLRARISKIVAGDTLERMIGAPSVEEAFRMVSGTPFDVAREVYARTRDLKLAELEILKKEIGLHTEIEKYLSGGTREFVRTLASRYEIDNLKNALRLFVTRTVRKRPVDELVPYLVRERILYDVAVDGIVNSENPDEIVKILTGTPYAGIVEQQKTVLEKDRSLFRLEMALDKFYYQTLINDTQKLTPRDRKTALRIIGIEIDMQNIDWIIRFNTYYDLSRETVQDLLIQGGQMLPSQSIRDVFVSRDLNTVLGDIIKKYYPGLSSMLSSQGSDADARLLLIERILEQIMSYEVRHILEGYPFTIGILLSYLALKRNEIRKVLTILNAKLYDLPGDRIRAAL